MRILFDTNVVLDVLLARAPHAENASELFSRVERRRLIGLVCGTTITTVHYLARKSLGADGAREQIRRLLSLFEIAAVTRAVIDHALALDFADFEDAVLHESARFGDGHGIVSRNTADFANATLPVYTPVELLAILRAADIQHSSDVPG